MDSNGGFDLSVSLEKLEERLNKGLDGGEKPKGKKKAKDKDEPTLCAYFAGLVDIIGNDNGGVAYLVNNENSLEIATVWEVNGVLCSPPDKR